jgi:putative ABC transport system permease protein
MAMPDSSTPRESTGWMAEWARDIRFATRGLIRTPSFSFAIIISLGVGLALAATTLAITNAYLLRALPYAGGDRLHHVMYAPPGPYEPRGMTALDWSSLDDVVEATVTSAGEGYFIGEGTGTTYVRATRASPGFMSGLGVRPAIGHTFTEADFKPGAPEVGLIGHALWRTRFNSDPNIVGRQIRARPEGRDGEPINLRIAGVLPEGFWFGRTSGMLVEMIVPLRTPARTYMIKLRPGVPVGYAGQRITEAARRVGSDFRPDWTGVHLEALRHRYVAELRPLLFGINAATVLVFVLVCANVAILILLRALRRQKEIAVRISLGAGQRQLLRMLLAEAAVLCIAAVGTGIVITTVALRVLGPMIEARMGKPPPAGPAGITVDPTVLLLTGAAALGVALLLGLVPLVLARRLHVSDQLRRTTATATDGRGMRRMRSVLIALEVAGALALLAGGGLMIRSVLNLVRTDLGFEAERVVRATVHLPATYREPAAQVQFFTTLAQRLAAANTESAVGGSFPPFYESHKRSFESDAAPGEVISMGGLNVGAGYFAVHGIEVRQGREFTLSDILSSEPVAIVSESLARQLWPGRSALGQRVRGIEVSEPGAQFGPWRRIVGVVRDVRQTYADTDLRDVYFPFLQSPTRFGSVQLRTDRVGGVAAARLVEWVAEQDPLVRVGDPRTLASEDQQFARARFMTGLVGGFALFATLLALLGIYGVTAYAVRQREREIAIRVALGATNARVIRLFLREGVVVLGSGLALGFGLAAAVSRVVESQLHGVKPFDALTIITAGIFLLACGILATCWPVRRAAHGDVVMALKTE